MADIFDKLTKRILKSVDTIKYIPGGEYYEADRYITNPAFVPDCASKYIFVEGDNTIREMTQQEKDAEDYVAPPPPPTAEQKETTRLSNIRAEIEKTYPNLSGEMIDVWKTLAQEFPGNEKAQAYNTVILDAEAMYPKV
ncbi:MAG: hypothetical protein KAJ03_00435 [Gammaproteobacteria bacterium]|nr:hypothetical protein [Gammaproteobacteria bacterium]